MREKAVVLFSCSATNSQRQSRSRTTLSKPPKPLLPQLQTPNETLADPQLQLAATLSLAAHDGQATPALRLIASPCGAALLQERRPEDVMFVSIASMSRLLEK